MGLFIEDLINFGNLVDTEVEVKLSPEDFKRVFPEYEFSFEDRLVKIRGVKKVFFLKRGFEFRGAQESDRVFNRKDFNVDDFGVYLRMLSKEGVDELIRDDRFAVEDGFLRWSLIGVFRATEVFKKIPERFKDRILIRRYRVRKDTFSIYVTVTK